MKKIMAFLITLFFAMHTIAQDDTKKEVFTFTITDYLTALNDSMSLVEVKLPAVPANILELKKLGVLKHNHTNVPDDTATVGIGRCQLIKGEYYYFGLRLDNKKDLPKPNDLLYVFVDYPAKYKGQIYKMVRNAIYLTHVSEENFYQFGDAALLDEEKENIVIDSMVADIKYTADVMSKSNPEMDQLIKGGIFDGKKIFAAMQSVTRENVKDFLGYVIARPKKYAGNTWKVSETMATWMVSNTPTVKKN